MIWPSCLLQEELADMQLILTCCALGMVSYKAFSLNLENNGKT